MLKRNPTAGTVTSGEPAFDYGEGLHTAPEEYIAHYRAARTREAAQKARLFGLKNGVLTGELLDCGECVYAISAVFIAVRDNILASDSLSRQAKSDLLNRLADCVQFELADPPPEPVDPPIPKVKPTGWTAYMFQRLCEVSARAQNFALKADQLERGLLRRDILESELPKIAKAIESVLGRSRLSPREKADAGRNLEQLSNVLDSIRHHFESPEAKNGNGNGADDDS
jgi:phage terminase Nu1 subunit (DNA packaging protein)